MIENKSAFYPHNSVFQVKDIVVGSEKTKSQTIVAIAAPGLKNSSTIESNMSMVSSNNIPYQPYPIIGSTLKVLQPDSRPRSEQQKVKRNGLKHATEKPSKESQKKATEQLMGSHATILNSRGKIQEAILSSDNSYVRFDAGKIQGFKTATDFYRQKSKVFVADEATHQEIKVEGSVESKMTMSDRVQLINQLKSTGSSKTVFQ